MYIRIYRVGTLEFVSTCYGCDVFVYDASDRRHQSTIYTRADIAQLLRFYRKGPHGTIKREKVNI